MRTVDALTAADRGTVWRCPAFTVAWIDGQWCRLDYHQWIALDPMPAGPFHDLGDHPDFSDYRDSLLKYHGASR